MWLFLKKTFLLIVFGIVILGILALVAAYYFGILDWQSTQTDLRVAASQASRNLAEAVEGGGGLSGDPYGEAQKCRENMQRIENAKKRAAQNKGTEIGTVTWDEVLPHLNDKKPVCPSGGVYTLNDLQHNCTCSMGPRGTMDAQDDHLLPSLK